jgi:integrase
MDPQTTQTKARNEKVKRAYFHFLREAQGFSPLSVEAVEKAIWKWEEFTQEADLGKFNTKAAKSFKEWLAARKGGRSGDGLSLGTQYHILRHLKDFFSWLSGQPGFKSRIDPFDIQYLKLAKKEARMATAAPRQEFPTLEQVQALCGSIVPKTEVDRRDRALIAFTLLTGMRDKAVITLPTECFDADKLLIHQDPQRGVQTKFSKTISTMIFRFDEELLGVVLDWYRFLREEKLFGNTDPLFPRTKLEQKSEMDLSFDGTEVDCAFWATTQGIRNIFKRRAEAAGLRYYSPHKFRHTATVEAFKHCRTAEELRAISQNFGHENIGTTFSTYGKLPDFQVEDIIARMNFKKDATAGGESLDDVPKEKLMEALSRRMR